MEEMKTVGRIIVGEAEPVDAIVTISTDEGAPTEVHFSTEKDRGDIYLVIDREELITFLGV